MKYELSHDTIARQVYDKASTEAKRRRQVQSLVNVAYLRYRERGVLLSKEDLEEIAPFLTSIDFPPAQAVFLLASRRALEKKRQQRRTAVTLIILVLALFSLISLTLARRAERTSRNLAVSLRQSIANRYAADATVKNSVDDDPIGAVRLALTALENDSTNQLAQEQLYRAYYRPPYEYRGKYYHLSFPFRQFQHENAVIKAFFLPDGQTILSAGIDGAIRRWIPGDSVPETVLYRHQDQIFSLAANARANLLAAGTRDGQLLLGELESGSLKAIPLHSKVIHGLAISADGRRIATAAWDSTVLVLNRSGELRHRYEFNDACYLVHFDQRGRLLVGTNSELFLIEGGRKRRLSTHKTFTGAFSPDGKYLAVSGDNKVQIYDHRGNLLFNLTDKDAKPFFSIAFSPDGKYLATGGTDSKIRLWQLDFARRSGEVILTLAHDNVVNAVAFSPDGRYLITGSGDHTVRLWDLEAHPLVVLQHEASVAYLDFYTNDHLVSGGIDSTLKFWRRDGTLIRTLKVRNPWSFFTPNSVTNAQVISVDGKYGIWDFFKGQILFQGGKAAPVKLDPETLQYLAMLPGDTVELGHRISFGDSTTLFQFVDMADQQRFTNLTAFGNTVAYFNNLDTLFIHDFASNTYQTYPSPHSDEILFLEWLNNDFLLTTSRDNTARLTRVGDWKSIVIAQQNDEIAEVQFTPSMKYYLTSSYSDEMIVWKTPPKLLRGDTIQPQRLAIFQGLGSTFYTCAIAPDAQSIAGGDSEGQVIIWPMYFPEKRLVDQIKSETNLEETTKMLE